MFDNLYRYIAIEGNIGVGKTTLANLLAKKIKCDLILEEFEENYFLPLFYKDKARYAFHTEIGFILQRYEQLMTFNAPTGCTIADYYFMKTLIFAKNNLKTEEFNLFFKLYQNLKRALPKPDLILYLHRSSENLLQNINTRGRSYEADMTADYLNQIDKAYNHYLLEERSNLRIVRLDIDKIDFLKDSKHFEQIHEKLKQQYPIGITDIQL